MARWASYLVDINGFFLMREFDNYEKIYTPVSD